jgi:hypothetical protein
MRARSFLKKTVVALILLAFGVWAVYLWISLPHDTIRENITIEEAQSLVSFSICMPAYQPPETNPEPRIVYDADAANVPEETYIRLQFRRKSDQKKVFEIYQRYTPDAGMKIAYPDKGLEEGAKVNLLYWVSYQKLLSIDAALAHTQIVSSVFQNDGTVWWLYEITDPIKYRSTMTEWIKDHVEYRILSLLSAEEIKKVTLSMLECSNP